MRITLPTGTPAEIARPANGVTPTHGLVMWPDIRGLRPLFDSHAQRVADAEGWVVVVPEMWPGHEYLDISERLERAGELRDDDKQADAAMAAELTECDTVGVMGFCMGGMYAMKASASGEFDAAVSFYGMIRMPDAWRAPHQADAIDSVAAPDACPVLALCGTEDKWLPHAELDELAEVATVVRYSGADHAFAQDPDGANYRADYAANAWARSLNFLRSGGSDSSAGPSDGGTAA